MCLISIAWPLPSLSVSPLSISAANASSHYRRRRSLQPPPPPLAPASVGVARSRSRSVTGASAADREHPSSDGFGGGGRRRVSDYPGRGGVVTSDRGHRRTFYLLEPVPENLHLAPPPTLCSTTGASFSLLLNRFGSALWMGLQVRYSCLRATYVQGYDTALKRYY